MEDKDDKHSLDETGSSSVNNQGEDHTKDSTKETQSMPYSHNDADNFVKSEADSSPVNLQ